jgi:uncharacterized membrane protein YhiD involved in acid resistance
MTFQDIFRTTFLDNIVSITILDLVMSISLAFALGLFIFFIYKRTYSGLMFSGSFGVSLIALTMITTLCILAVTSNVVLSLGMVGALSIVRFRAAIKDPIDIVFLFWSIAVGIVLAAGMIPLAVFGSLSIGLILFVFINKKSYDQPFILHVNVENQDTEKHVHEMLAASVKRLSIKSKGVAKGSIELHYEIRLLNDDSNFVNYLAEIEGVSNAVLVSYTGDYVG